VTDLPGSPVSFNDIAPYRVVTCPNCRLLIGADIFFAHRKAHAEQRFAVGTDEPSYEERQEAWRHAERAWINPARG
jgi:hypothetical protein